MLNFPAGSEGDVFRAQNDTRYVYEDGAWRVIDGAFTHNPGPSAPLDPELGDLWVDTSNCPPVLKIFDCDGNWIEIEGGGTDAINFTAVITDDGTDQANTPGHVLTASAQNITGGTAPVESAYKWLVGGLTMGTNKTINIVSSFVGKVVSCEVTVAEPDGTGAVVRTAVYSKIIEIAGTINKPTVLAPADGAGSGVTRPIVTDEITAVEGGGITTCETELIESVDTTTDAPNVILTFPSDKDFEYFDLGDVVQESSTQVVRDYLSGCSGTPAGADYSWLSVFSDQYEDVYGTSGTNMTCVIDTPVQVTSEVKFKVYILPGASLIINEGLGDEVEIVPDIQNDKTEVTRNDISRIASIRLNGSGTTCYFYWIEVDGKKLVDESVSTNPSIKVISKDDRDPFTIMVDGGAWKGSVSGESGDAADQETKLTKETPYDTKLTLAGAKDLADLKVGDVVKMGMDADVPYQPVSDSIVNVEGREPGFTYKLYVSADALGVDSIDDLVNLPTISTATYTEDVTAGNFPTYGNQTKYSLYEFDTPSTISVIRKNSNLASNPSLAWSDDGETWINAIFDKPGGIGPTNPIESSEYHKYYCFWFNSASHTASNFAPDPTYQSPEKTLTLSGDTDLAYFRPGDVVQGTAGDPDEVKVISKDDSVPSITVDGGDWYADPANGGDGSGETDGDTEVTCVSPLKAPTDWTVEGIEGNTLSLSHASVDNSQVWVANDNQAGTDFYVTGPQIVDEPLLTADVELESSLFATTPPGVDTLSNIVWEVNGVEQDAGTTNPYKPTLNTNTTYTVRVKHQGNTLDESPWSDQTTFTTGATRNLYTYYKERVEVLENRIAGIEADEVVDDATDVTLLTVVADLINRVESLENP